MNVYETSKHESLNNIFLGVVLLERSHGTQSIIVIVRPTPGKFTQYLVKIKKFCLLRPNSFKLKLKL